MLFLKKWGIQKIVWKLEGLNEGIYCVTIGTSRIATGRLEAGEQVVSGKVVKLK